MSTAQKDVLGAGYQDVDRVRTDFDALVARVAAKDVAIEGVILVTHTADGAVSVPQTGHHLGRTGLG